MRPACSLIMNNWPCSLLQDPLARAGAQRSRGPSAAACDLPMLGVRGGSAGGEQRECVYFLFVSSIELARRHLEDSTTKTSRRARQHRKDSTAMEMGAGDWRFAHLSFT